MSRFTSPPPRFQWTGETLRYDGEALLSLRKSGPAAETGTSTTLVELDAESDAADAFVLLPGTGLTGHLELRVELCPEDGGPWYPCVLEPDGSGAVQMSLGGASSGRCQALFDAAHDRAIQILEPLAAWRLETDGTPAVSLHRDVVPGDRRPVLKIRVVENHFRLGCGLPLYSPIDKQSHPLPPSGWCSWYELKGAIDEGNILSNLREFAEKLKPFGGECFQVDDGWQGSDEPGGSHTRDWWLVNGRKFPRGMKRLAEAIREAGMRPGIWLIPQGQSDQELATLKPRAFLWREDGSSVNERIDPATGTRLSAWMGRYLVDPTHPDGLDLIRRTVRRMALEWGFEYLKIDGQGELPGILEECRAFSHKSCLEGVLAYRSSIHAIRSELGPRRYLMGCIAPRCAVDLFNGARTGGDVTPDADGLVTAMEATRSGYFLHNVVWYSDPDAVLVRPPLTEEQARSWATIVGITGQSLMASDDLTKLPTDRLRVLQQIFPATDVRPLDLYQLETLPPVWDLRVRTSHETWDVVAVMNQARFCIKASIDAKRLGWEDEGPFHLFDFWRDRYYGTIRGPLRLLVGGVGAELLCFRKAMGRPQVLSTSRHLTQGWLDLEGVAWDEGGRTLSGTSIISATDSYAVTLVVPQGSPTRYVYRSHKIEEGGQVLREGSLLRIRWLPSTEERRVRWAIAFTTASVDAPAHQPPEPIRDLSVSRERDLIRLDWTPTPASIGTAVERDGAEHGLLLGHHGSLAIRIQPGEPPHLWTVRAAGPGGARSLASPSAPSEPLPAATTWRLADHRPDLELTGDMKVVHDSSGTGSVGTGIEVAGKRYGTSVEQFHSPWMVSWMDYRLHGHRNLTGAVAVAQGRGPCKASISVNGTIAFSIETLRAEDGPRSFTIRLEGSASVRFLASWVPAHPGASSVLWLDVAAE